MSEGKILVAEHNGTFVIKLVGDVRLTLCTTIDDYFSAMFASPQFTGVLFDLSDAECIDSTSLGMMAKLAVQARHRYQLVPIIVSPNPNITRLLDTMGFGKVFEICKSIPQPEQVLGELPVVLEDEDRVRLRIIEAHRVLMDLNEKNRETFSSLVNMLEAG